MIAATLGNTELLKLHKTAFLCSRKIPASVVLKCYDWAIEQREKGNCVIGGFHSQIEKDVLHYLLKGSQPIIVALARGLKQKIEPQFVEPLNQGRLLIVAPFEASVTRVTQQTAQKRNEMMLQLADDVTIGFATPTGLIYNSIKAVNKPLHLLFN